MDIKLKAKHQKIWLLFFLCIMAILVSLGIYYLVDDVFNGSFLDWFDQNYMITEEHYLADTGKMVLVREPAWDSLKVFLLQLLILFMIAFLFLVYGIASVCKRQKAKETITEISQMLHTYMIQEKEITEVFPGEYAEISVQIAEIKSTMAHHEQILKEEASRKNDLIAYLAHDLKTPLTSIIGYLSLLKEAPDMPEIQKEKYTLITLEKSLRLEKLINEFFDITRYNLQQIDLEKETIDLHYMLIQMTDEFYPLLSHHGNTAELVVDDTMTIYGDAEKLARVFNNILKNAIAYSYPNTPIKIRAKKADHESMIFFTNYGKTIPKKKLDFIFEKFFRLDEARVTHSGGAGLGLAIAKEIIFLHGGTISVTSENECTTFCVTLPENISSNMSISC